MGAVAATSSWAHDPAFLLPAPSSHCSSSRSPAEHVDRARSRLPGPGCSVSSVSCVLGALAMLGRRRRRTARSAQEPGFSIAEVERCWDAAKELEQSPEELASTCALLCCIQRQLGTYAVVYEGQEGTCEILHRAPPLPMVLSWEDCQGDEVYKQSYAVLGGNNLLSRLLICLRQVHLDCRFGAPADPTGKSLRAKVSFLKSFTDISETPESWSLGQHGLWLSWTDEDGEDMASVFLPEAIKRIAGIKGERRALANFKQSSTAGVLATDDLIGELISEDVSSLPRPVDDALLVIDVPEEEDPLTPAQRMLEVFRDRSSVWQAWQGTSGSLPPGHVLYRFEVEGGSCDYSSLPTSTVRQVNQDHLQLLVTAQARAMLQDSLDAQPRFATLAVPGGQVRAVVVPTDGAYSNAHRTFFDRFPPDESLNLRQANRIFVLADVWDCYIDGIGLPDSRCAWYGKMSLNLVILEKLRRTGNFSELTLKQDESERAVEVLMPIIEGCLAAGRELTLVPLLMGGMKRDRLEAYAEVIAPYLSETKNMFVVAGDLEKFARFLEPSSNSEDDLSWDLQGSATTSLELFARTLLKAPAEHRLSINRVW